ncbi:unnamed protein product (mitochondrion) [Plasmodiophora brassicae]|uniref:Protein farnesyltransferase/geranylgeranyltransferase type-1 subunit alpha n=1 Tax=Plasmodiophora brassicae TaxID=37360 RepID=A0A3P3YCF4_PLABS|nr:unnamed protein product [Plasmodiophora brassicae]
MVVSLAELRDLFHDVARVRQDDGPDSVVAIQYPPDFVEAMDLFRAMLKADEMSERALMLTEYVIELNSANYTAWQYRRRVIEALDKDWRDELALCDAIGGASPKNYQLWNHRREVIQKLGDASGELEVTAVALEDDAKNYHVWGHRQWCIATFGLWDDEIAFAEKLLVADPYNNSAWNQRWFVVTRNNTVAWTEDVARREVAFAQRHLSEIADNESPWNYVLGILDATKYALPKVVDEAVTFAEGLPSCRFAAGLLFDVYEVLGRLPEATEVAGRLETSLDVIRSRYWAWRRDQLKPEQ